MSDKQIRELVKVAYQAADDKKAIDLVTLDISAISLVADYFVICSGRTDTQVKAIAEEVAACLEKKGVFPKRVEGKREGVWILLDYCDFVVHIFRQQEREYYNLDRLWADARQVATI